MTPRRKQTTPPPPSMHSVRFYKMIALSFLGLTVVLFAVVMFMVSKRATIVVTTTTNPVDVSTSVTVGSEGDIPGQIRLMTVSTTFASAPTGNREEPGIAVGEVTLHNDSDRDQPLVKVTRLLTSDDILFRINKDVIVPANGSIEVGVYADVEGKQGNIAPVKRFRIPGLSSLRQNDVYASSETSMSGGIRKVGTVSDEDIDIAKKKLVQLLEEKAEEVTTTLSTDKKIVFGVTDTTITVPDNIIGEETSSFVLEGVAEVIAVLYDEEDVTGLSEQALLKHVVDDSEQLDINDSMPTVTFDSYDKDDGLATLEVFHDGVVTLVPESKQLQKLMFYGKTKDEIRRYVLSLDHVSGVQVRLSPAWTRTVPHVPDHVNIIVKQVE